MTLLPWPLNGVTGHRCHRLPCCQFSASYAKAAEGGLGWRGKTTGGPGALGGLRDEVPQKLKNFKSTSRFYAFLVLFHTFHLYMPMFFSVLAGIIPLSLRNVGGIWYRLPPLPPCLQVRGQLPPAPPPMFHTPFKFQRHIGASAWPTRRCGSQFIIQRTMFMRSTAYSHLGGTEGQRQNPLCRADD